MKLTTFLLLVTILNVFASNTYLQNARLNLDMKDVPIQTVLNAIEGQSEFFFLYSSKMIEINQKVDINVADKKITEVLDELLANKGIKYSVKDQQILLFNKEGEAVFAFQQNKITGTVTDEAGSPLPGVNIQVEGTVMGIITDINGKYSIEKPNENVILIFSFIGYETEKVSASGKTIIDIKLVPTLLNLDEVVVIGYGVQSRRIVTGSVTKVDMKPLANLPSTNAAQALRGRVAGLQYTDNGRPGLTGSFLIRGQRSISASNSPLVVLDGIIFGGSFNDINPGDIASMEILKDASAAAIYGSRASNGVILITSKIGITEKPTIRFNTSYGISNWSHKYKLHTPERYIQKLLEFRKQSGLAADPDKITDYLQPTEAENYTAGKTIDPWDVVSQSSSIQNYEISVSGLSGKTNYYVSANYNDEKGLIYNDNAARTSFRVNFKNQINDWLGTGINVQYAERNNSGNAASVAAACWQSPFAKVWLDEAKTDPNPIPTQEMMVGSIVFSAIKNKNEAIARNLFANFYGIVDFPFLKGLSYRINFSPNHGWYVDNDFSPIYQRLGLDNKGSARQQATHDWAWVLENILNYNKQIGKNHNFDVTLLYGRSQDQSNSLIGSGSDFTGSSDANGWNNLSLAKIQATRTSALKVDGISSMARLNYRFKDRYLLTLTARRDGSSVFGADHKFGTFPSAALAWIASEESFFKTIPTISLLKFRASYGSVGNQAISAYQSLTSQGQVQYVFGDGGSTSTGLYPANLANPTLGWETTTTANIAADFELWKGRIGGTIEYYNMDTKDLLLTRALPSPMGFPSMFTNIGETSNKGVEVTINTINLRKGKLEWSSNLVFSTNKNKIVHLYHSDVNNDGIEDDDLGNRWFIGQPISVAYDYRVVGVYQEGDQIPAGQHAGYLVLQDFNNDGTIDAKDRQVLGTLQPKYRWGFSNNIKYGNFNLMVMLNAMHGWMGNNPILSLDMLAGSKGSGNYPGRTNFIDLGWWTPENKSNTRSSLVYSNPYNHAYWQSRDFLRIQEVLLSYDLPKQILNYLKINSLTVYLSCRNLYTLTGWQNMDPESGIGYTGAFPIPRTFTVGLNTSF